MSRSLREKKNKSLIYVFSFFHRLPLQHFVQKVALTTSMLYSVLSVRHRSLSMFLLWNISLPAVLFIQKGTILILSKSVTCTI